MPPATGCKSNVLVPWGLLGSSRARCNLGDTGPPLALILVCLAALGPTEKPKVL